MTNEKKTVLVADDEPTIRELYVEELQEEGYEVISASTAREAVQLAEDKRPDLVIMDVRMPGMDGIEAMHRILEHNNETPIIINSAYSSYHDSYMSWTADAYVIKSSDMTELKETTARLLNAEESERTAAIALAND